MARLLREGRSIGTWSPDNDGALVMANREATGPAPKHYRVELTVPLRFSRLGRGGARGALRRVDRPSQRHARAVPFGGPRDLRRTAIAAGWEAAARAAAAAEGR